MSTADMHPLDKARALKALFDRYQSYERVAQESAWSVSTVRKYVQLLTLPEELQQRLDTANGPIGVGALARLASTFSGGDAVVVYERISGFTPRIQEEIVKRSEGDIETIEDLVGEAHEGAFDVRRCGLTSCAIISEIVRGRLSQPDFHKLVVDAAAKLSAPGASDKHLRDAARAFWRALAVG